MTISDCLDWKRVYSYVCSYTEFTLIMSLPWVYSYTELALIIYLSAEGFI